MKVKKSSSARMIIGCYDYFRRLLTLYFNDSVLHINVYIAYLHNHFLDHYRAII